MDERQTRLELLTQTFMRLFPEVSVEQAEKLSSDYVQKEIPRPMIQKTPSGVLFDELRKLIPTIPPNCQKLVLTLEPTKASYDCECIIKEEHIAQQTTNPPGWTVTEA